MTRVLCAYSGVEFKVQFFPTYLHSRECYHPIFDLPTKKLLQFSGKWAAQELDSTENYLYYLALFNSTGLVEWRVPAIRTQFTDSIVAQNMEQLLSIVSKLDLVSTPQFQPPRFVISPETKDLSNTQYWIKTWESSWSEFNSGYRDMSTQQKIIRREAALEKLIKDHSKSVDDYAVLLADWAAMAGNFPTEYFNIFKGQKLTRADYWKLIIRRCINSHQIFEIPDEDLEELLEYCETSFDLISHGIFSHTLITLLREGKRRKHNYLDLGTFDVSGPGYRITDENTSVESANMQALIASAPLTEPTPEQYPTKIAFIKAKLKWDMAQRYKTDNGTNGESK